MARCPKCKTILSKPEKTWKHRELDVNFFICGNCGTRFREYLNNEKIAYTLMFKDGHYRKV